MSSERCISSKYLFQTTCNIICNGDQVIYHRRPESTWTPPKVAGAEFPVILWSPLHGKFQSPCFSFPYTSILGRVSFRWPFSSKNGCSSHLSDLHINISMHALLQVHICWCSYAPKHSFIRTKRCAWWEMWQLPVRLFTYLRAALCWLGISLLIPRGFHWLSKWELSVSVTFRALP